MTNNEIIFENVRASFTPAQLAELVNATYTADQLAARRANVTITVDEGNADTAEDIFTAMLAADQFHTFAEWKRMGYSVKKGAKSAITCQLWKYTDKPGKAVREAAEDNTKTGEADKLRAELAQSQEEAATLRGDLYRAANEIDELKNKLAELHETKTEQPAAEAVEPKTAAEIIAARWAEVDGLTATIKGATTAAPVVWLAGDTKPHEKEIEAAGGKWSGKKNAYYFRVA